MSNVFRALMPLLHRAKAQLASDAVTYKPAGQSEFQTSASPLTPQGVESVQQGNNLHVAMTKLQLGAIVPATGDEITRLGVLYRVVDVVADDYDGYSLSLRRK